MTEDALRRDAGALSVAGGSIATVVIRILQSQYPAEPDVFKLDFSLPGDPAYGDHPEFEVFNRDAGHHSPFPPEYFTPLTHDPNQNEFVFTIANRIQGLATEQPDLLAVLPHVRPELCDYQLRLYGGLDTVTDQSIDLTPFPNTVDEPTTIVVPVYSQTSAGGCLLHENILYYVHSIYAR